VVAGPVAALVAAEGLEGASGDVGSGESTVPVRGFLPRLAAEDTVGTTARLLMTSSRSGASHALELLPWRCTGWAQEGASKDTNNATNTHAESRTGEHLMKAGGGLAWCH
jgi:hypothetical protein